jgi:putative tricarboxylic transport membrane protein
MNDRILGIVSLGLAIFLTIFGWNLHAPVSYEPVGPRAFPLLIALVIGLCGLWLIYKNEFTAEANPPGANSRIFLMVLVAMGYAFLFQWLGFIVATVIMTVLVGRLFGGAWIKCLTGGVVMGVLFFLLFDRALDVVLPTGILEGLL